MGNDVRLDVGFWDHPKTEKLTRLLGLKGPVALQQLWFFAAKNRPEGILHDMDEIDIEIAAKWKGEEGKFVEAVLAVRFLDKSGSVYAIHDWRQHQPWVTGAPQRKLKAKKAALKRHGYTDEEISKLCSEDATGMPQACSGDAVSMQRASFEHAHSNAPSPSPSPTPYPKPSPNGGGSPSEPPSSCDSQKNTSETKKETAHNHDDIELFEYFKTCKIKFYPDAIIPNGDDKNGCARWVNAAKSLRVIRKRPVQEIKSVTKFLFSDNCPQRLRERVQDLPTLASKNHDFYASVHAALLEFGRNGNRTRAGPARTVGGKIPRHEISAKMPPDHDLSELLNERDKNKING